MGKAYTDMTQQRGGRMHLHVSLSVVPTFSTPVTTHWERGKNGDCQL